MWGAIISQWEKALNENKEVICALDANIHALTWTSQNLPSNHSNVKLKPLIDDIFETNFDKYDFKLRVSQMPELGNILESSCANQAAELLMAGLTRGLDRCAPVRTIQTRSRYAPHLQEFTKQLMDQQNTAQLQPQGTLKTGDFI